MSLDRISAGDDAPDAFNVVIEIPMRGEPVKYEVDKDSGMLMVDRIMSTAMHYPTNYGYVPATLAEDGDPVDALVLTPVPLLAGSVIECRAVGMLMMSDEKGEDQKILAVPIDKVSCDYYVDVRSPDDLPKALLEQISHFFEHYKDLEKGKWVKIEDWKGPKEAREEISASIARYRG
ncbi:MAG TPA: inorganic diphosphatase [Gammaproteobacteria bacterium]|nr:inorganic diphosphatase [Gammaproteobacteria bacterium]